MFIRIMETDTDTCMDFIYHRHRRQTANVNSNSKCIHTPRLQPALLAGLVQLSTEIFPFWKNVMNSGWGQQRPGPAEPGCTLQSASPRSSSWQWGRRCVSRRSLSSSRLTSRSISITELSRAKNKWWASFIVQADFQSMYTIFINAMISLYVVCRVR